MKTMVKTLIVALATLTLTLINTNSPNAHENRAVWSEWQEMKDGLDNQLSFRYMNINETSMQFEIRNEYAKPVTFSLEVNTTWDWLPKAKNIDYVYNGVLIGPGKTINESLKGSRINGTKIMKIKFVEEKVTL